MLFDDFKLTLKGELEVIKTESVKLSEFLMFKQSNEEELRSLSHQLSQLSDAKYALSGTR